MKKVRVLELFAGAGGMALGLEKAGLVSTGLIEINKDACATLLHNRPSWNVIHGDVTDVDYSNFSADVVVGGFPCQAFSNAGLKKGFEDTRGTLFFDIARILKHHKPEAFLLENVKGLRSHDSGNTLTTIIKVLNGDLKYHLHVEVLNAKHFGLPQNRERIFIVGFKKQTDFQFPVPPMTKTRLGDILHKRTSDKFTISDRI